MLRVSGTPQFMLARRVSLARSHHTLAPVQGPQALQPLLNRHVVAPEGVPEEGALGHGVGLRHGQPEGVEDRAALEDGAVEEAGGQGAHVEVGARPAPTGLPWVVGCWLVVVGRWSV